MEKERLKEAPIIYTLQETAAILRVTERTVYTYIYQKKLKATKACGTWRITGQAIQDFLDSGTA